MTPFGVVPRMSGSRFFAPVAAIVPRERVRPPRPRPLPPIPGRARPRQWEAEIIRAVCAERGFLPDEVMSASRDRDLYAARAEIVRRLFAVPGRLMSNGRAALLFGRDVSTICVMRRGGKGRGAR